MKTKHYLAAACMFVLGTTSVYGQFSCPKAEKTTVEELAAEGWEIDKKHKPKNEEEYLKHFENAKFKGAWIFHPNKGISRCNFEGIQFIRKDGKDGASINTSTYKFEPPAEPDKKGKGLHCKQKDPTYCEFVPL